MANTRFILNETSYFGFGAREVLLDELKDRGYKVMMVGDGLNDVLAFNNADISVLTVEQEEEVSPKLINKTDYVIQKISEVISIDF